MPKVLAFSENPALRIAKERASSQFVATRRVLDSGSYKSPIGSCRGTKAVSKSTAHRRKK